MKMRTFHLILFVFGLLAYSAPSAPVTSGHEVAVRGLDQLKREEHPSEAQLAKRSTHLANALGIFENADVKVRGLDDLTHEEHQDENEVARRAVSKRTPKKKAVSKEKTKRPTKKKTTRPTKRRRRGPPRRRRRDPQRKRRLPLRYVPGPTPPAAARLQTTSRLRRPRKKKA
jgi:hypothetical protein